MGGTASRGVPKDDSSKRNCTTATADTKSCDASGGDSYEQQPQSQHQPSTTTITMSSSVPSTSLQLLHAEVESSVASSDYLRVYTVQYRDALRRKKSKGHAPQHNRLHEKALAATDKMLGRDGSLCSLKRRVLERSYGVVGAEVVQGIAEDATTPLSLDQAETRSRAVVRRAVDGHVDHLLNDAGQRVLSSGHEDAVTDSADESCSSNKRVVEAAERRRAAAEERGRQASRWHEVDRTTAEMEARAWAEACVARSRVPLSD
eukprot:PhM_4_TR8396/c6_g2_i1/m.62497